MDARHGERGFILALVLVILAILTVFALAMTIMSRVNIETAGNVHADQRALNLAYSRYQRAQQYIIDHDCTFNDPTYSGANLLDTDGDGYLDLDDTLATQAVTCEEVLPSSPDSLKNSLGIGILTIKSYLKCCANTDVQRDHFLITATGELQGVKKKIIARVEHKSFLSFARFTNGNLGYGNNATVEGEVYVGGTLSVSSGDIFKKDVYVRGSISNESLATFEGEKYKGYDKTIDLNVDNQLADMYDEALNCGWVISQNAISGHPATSGDRACLGGSRFTGGENTDDNLLDFTRFKNLDNSIKPGDPGYTGGPRYEGPDCTHNLPSNFNGIIFWDDSNGYDLHVQGTLGVDEDDGKGTPYSVAGRGVSMVIISRTRNIRVDNHVRTGTNYLGQPVNIGYVVSGSGMRFIFNSHAPAYLVHQGAIMVTKTTSSCWKREDSATQSAVFAAFDSTPAGDTPCGTTNRDDYCSYDLDGDGNIESPNEYGWYENNVHNGRTDILVQWGPIITQASGNAGMWHYDFSAESGVKTSDASTRIYHYDPDILKYPPPFPKIKNLLHLVSYTEQDE